MIVAHVCRQYTPGVGGLESQLKALCAEQVASGHDVRVITLNRIFPHCDDTLPADELIDGVKVKRIPFFGSQRYPIAPSVLRHIRDCDIVHVHAVDFFVDFLALTKYLHRKPLVLSTHGGYFHSGFAQRAKKIYFQTVTRMALQSFRAVLASSPSDGKTFARICAQKVSVVENGVDTEKFADVAGPDTRTIISFGRIAPNKEPARLIRWLARIRKIDPTWRLIIAGKPMGVDVGDLKQLCVREGLADAVEIHISPSDDVLRSLIARSSVFASASSYEGFGLAVVEAVSAGLFPVVSDIAPHRNSCSRLNTGVTIDFEQPQSPQLFLRSFELYRATRSKGAMESSLDTFSWRRAATKMDRVYRAVLGVDQRRIGRISIDVMDRTAAVARISGLIARREPQTVSFCNAHTVNMARHNMPFAKALKGSIVLNDGFGVDLASLWTYGRKFPTNLNGTDFVPQLLAAQRHPVRICLVGSAPGVAAAAGRAFESCYPNVTIVGAFHGFFDDQEAAGLIREVCDTRPDLVLLGMGHPRQELFASQWIETVKAPIISVGALFDFQAGVVSRAPEWVRRHRLEWFYRLSQEPSRLMRRYLIGNILFLAHCAKEAWTGPELDQADPVRRSRLDRAADAA